MKIQTLSKLVVFTVSVSLLGCGSFGKKMKSFLGGESAPAAPAGNKSAKIKFSEVPNVNPNSSDRLYRRVNKEIFEKEGVLDDRAGSLWAMEGQTSYLFAANTNRLPGDIINIELEGAPRAQLEKKVDIIKSLLEKSRKIQRTQAAAPQEGQPAPEKKTPDAKAGAAKTASAESAIDKQEEAEEKASQFDVTKIPTRIVEQGTDGSYRVKGSQTFMIGKREYKVIATGLVRPTDVKDDSIQASRILDSRFDIVSMKKDVR
jgi:flagellar L-ring protein precursor FlgH